MDCRTCQPTLIDLLHGVLATDAVDAARAHLRECASCSAAYETLSAGQRFGRTLEMAEPPAAVSERIMAFAEAHARKTQQQRAAAALPGAQGIWKPLLEFVSRFAMARQVGMVTISLLIVAVGLWSLPQLKGSPTGVPAVAGGTVLNPDAEESATPSTGVQPAERLGLKMDARAGRILSKDGETLGAAPTGAPVPAQPPATEAVAVAAPAKRSAPAAHALDDLNAPLDVERRRSAETAERTPSSQRARAESSAIGEAGSSSSRGDTLSRAVYAAEPTQSKRKSRSVAEPAAFPKNEYEAGGGLAAAAAPSKASNAAPRSSLDLARDVADKQGCSAALPRYQQIVAAGGTTAEAGEALLEIARCQAARGDTVRARATLERAAHIAPVAPAARALLETIAQPAAPPAAADPSAGPR